MTPTGKTSSSNVLSVLDIAKKAKTFISLLARPEQLYKVIYGKHNTNSNDAHNLVGSTYWSIRQRIGYRWRIKMGDVPLDFSRPATFAEKCQWRKFYCPEVERFAQLADKYQAQEFVAGHIGDTHVVPVKWVGDRLTPEVVHQLGDDMVYHLTHRSEATLIVETVETTDIEALCRKANTMLDWPYSMIGQEPWYGHIKPRIIARRRVRNCEGHLFPDDYKFHLFAQPDGSKKVICAIGKVAPKGRFLVDEDFCPLPFEWNPTPYSQTMHQPSKPIQFDEMLADALLLSEGFDYVRIDFMKTEDEYYFTEFTFTSAGGHVKLIPSEYDEIVGDYWHLDTGNALQRVWWHARAWAPLWRTEMPVRWLRRLKAKTDLWGQFSFPETRYLQ